MQAAISLFTAIQLLFITLLGRMLPARLFEARPAEGGGVTITLPLEGGSDPWYYEHGGKFYYCYSAGSGVAVKTADSPAALGKAPETVVYRAPVGTAYSYSYWAPEMHFIDGAWYIYVAADDGNNENHRMYALKSDTPLGPYEMLGKVADKTDRWAIDGTVLEYGGELYFIWSGWAGYSDLGQNLYIAHMSDPAHIDGKRVKISAPEYGWEKKGHAINEGPEVLQRDGKTYIIYSASGSWTDDYCLGMLALTGDDVTDPACWAKCPMPVFEKRDTAYGPGHCSFLNLAGQDYIVYHANVESGTGWNGRTVRIQPFTWRGNVPVFGSPLPAGSTVTLPY